MAAAARPRSSPSTATNPIGPIATAARNSRRIAVEPPAPAPPARPNPRGRASGSRAHHQPEAPRRRPRTPSIGALSRWVGVWACDLPAPAARHRPRGTSGPRGRRPLGLGPVGDGLSRRGAVDRRGGGRRGGQNGRSGGRRSRRRAPLGRAQSALKRVRHHRETSLATADRRCYFVTSSQSKYATLESFRRRSLPIAPLEGAPPRCPSRTCLA